MAEKCKCPSATHGHEPGKCGNMAMEGSSCCEGCEDQNAEGGDVGGDADTEVA
jgi:hypothetical protein